MRQVFIRNSKAYRFESLQAHSRVWDSFWQLKAFKSYKKCFLFHIKSSFRSWNIYDFVLTFLVIQENSLIRHRKLISKFMTSETGKQIIIIHTHIVQISRSKDNQAITFDQLIKYNVRNISFHKSYGKSVRETSSSPLFIF